MDKKHQETFQIWDKIAQLYEEKFMDLDLYNDTYDAFCNLLPKKDASILEIGCGPGNITRYLSDRTPSFQITATDYSEQMIKLAKRNNPGATFKVLDCRQLSTLKGSIYDAIISGFTLPYLSDSECSNLISDCNKLLTPGGILYLSFVSGEYRNSGYIYGSTGDKTYFYYHQGQNIERKLKKNSFITIHFMEKEFKKSDDTIEVHNIIIAKKVNL